MTLVTLPAPDFTASAVLSNGSHTDNFNLTKYANKNPLILFFWPMDFTFVCPSELIAFDKYYQEFQQKKVKIVGVSFDSIFVHSAWRNTERHLGGIGAVQFVMVSDTKREIQKSYGIEHPTIGTALRASFLIDKNGIIRHQVINDLPFGRNIPEMLRMVDSLQFFENHGEVCPANWKKGEDGIHPSDIGLKKYFSKHF